MEDLLVGRTLKDTYRVDKPLADGGMSQVYLGTQLSLSRSVVLKVLSPGFNDADFIDLFLREARVCSQINHPNVVSVLDFGQTDDGIVFLVMELLDGETLGDIIAAKGPLSLAKTLWLMEQVCNGVHAAHKQDVIHRDLKPHNIMISRVSGDDTVAKVLDFGISKPLSEDDLKHTRLGMVMGTPGYLAPEQIESHRNIDPRADIYALGAILYFCLTGVAPYKGANRELIMNKQLSTAPAPLDSYKNINPACFKLQAVINKAMHLDKEQRYLDVKAMTRDMFSVVSSGKGGDPENKLNEGSNLLGFDENNEGQVTRYQYLFSGHSVQNIELSEAIAKVAVLCKLSEKSQKTLMRGKRIIIQKDLSRQAADRIKGLFEKSGLVGHVEEMTTATRIISRTQPSVADISMSAPVTMEPVTISDIQALKQSKIVEAHQASASSVANSSVANSSGSSGHFYERSKVRRAARFRAVWISASVFLLALMLGAWLYKPVYYKLHDLWIYTLLGKSEVRGVSEDLIDIGMSAAFSGSARELGRSMRIGIETYFESINESGGIHGRRLQLIAKNDNYDPKLALENINAFLDPESGVLAMLGNVGTPTAKAILPSVLESNTLLFGTFSGASLLRNNPPDRYVFNYRASYIEETEAIVHYFVKVKNIQPTKIGVFYQNDSFGQDGLVGVEKALAEYHINPTEILSSVYQRNTAQVDQAVDEFSSELNDLQAVIVVGTYSASAAFTREMRDLGFKGNIANVSFVGARALAELLLELGPGYAEKILITQVVPPYDSYATGVLNYRNDLKKYFPNEEPNFISLEGYISATLFSEGLLRSGRDFTEEELVNKLETIKDLDLGIGSKTSFDPSNHQASHRVWGVTIKPDGSFDSVSLE